MTRSSSKRAAQLAEDARRAATTALVVTWEVKVKSETKRNTFRRFQVSNVGGGAAYHVVAWVTDHPEGIANAAWITRPESDYRSLGRLIPNGISKAVTLEFGSTEKRKLMVIQYANISGDTHQYWLLQPGDGKREMKTRRLEWRKIHPKEQTLEERISTFFSSVNRFNRSMENAFEATILKEDD